jgi:hypothetical protein
MLKSKSSQSSGCTPFTKQAAEVQTNVVCQKYAGSCFLGQERCADDGIHTTRDHVNVTSVLRNLKALRRAIQRKMSGMLTSSVVLLHDNIHRHKSTVAGTRALLEYFNWELFDHPPYSPDLAPIDYRLSAYLRNWLG